MKSKDLRLLLSRSSSRKLFITAAIGSLVSAALVILNALLLGAVIVGIIYKHPSSSQWIVLLAALWIIRSVFTPFFESWCSTKAATIKSEIRREVSSLLATVEPVSSSELASLLVKGANSLDVYLGRFIPQLFAALVVPLTVIITVFFLDPLSALIAILTLPLIPFFGALIGRYTSDSVSKKWKSLSALSRYFEDSLQGFITLRIFGRNKSQGERIQNMGDRYTQETMSVLRISFLSAFVLELAATISVALIAVSIGLRLVDGKISFLHGLTVLILAPEIYFPLRNAASLFHASADGTEVLEQLRVVSETALVQVPQVHRDFASCKEITWRNWKLAIPDAPESRIPESTIHRGEVIFIVGESGIGKSSFANNLLGLHFDSEILIDGVALTPETVVSYQKSIAWVPQLPQLASGTIREQFTLMNNSAGLELFSDEAIIQSLQLLSLPLEELPQGLDTQLGGSDEKSAQMSGGQIRKIAVARALIRKPILIVADEPTADLDRHSATAIMTALRAAAENGAALVCISHDEDLQKSSDRVIAVERVKS